jgi:hypothetical protein
MLASQGIQVLKRDAFGRVELLVDAHGERFVRRVACGSKIPLSCWLARRLLMRERCALRALEGLGGVPRLVERDELIAMPGADGRIPRARDVLVRSWIDGAALRDARELPEDFFEELDHLLLELHARGVCHNDLHKEPNVIVAADGWPCLVDFQLASVHARRTRAFESRAREDLRHVEKHRARYTRFGRGPRGEKLTGRGTGSRRSWIAAAWRRFGKPVYNLITRGILHTEDGERARSANGPWPAWTAPIGAGSRAQSASDQRMSSR